MRLIYFVSFLMAGLMVAPAVAPAVPPVLAQDTLPRLESASCWMSLPYGVVEGEDIDCGYLIVPEDRSSASSPTIQLAYAILRAPGSDVKPDPVIYLEGGPGANGVGNISYWRHLSYLRDRDLILLDQRGTGYSLPTLNCPETEQDIRDAIQACHDRLISEGVNLQAYNSAENAADVADLRIALGYDEWNLFGVSYGTRLALTVMRDHPEGVRSVVIDSVYPPEVSSWEEWGQDRADEFNKLFESCAADARCSSAYPDLEHTFYSIVTQLNAEPAHYSGTNSDTGNPEDKDMSGDTFISRVYHLLYSSESIPYLPRVISQAANGNYAALDDLEFGAMFEPGYRQSPEVEDLSNSEGMYLSVECQEEVAFQDETRAVAHVPVQPFALHNNSVYIVQAAFNNCAIWNVNRANHMETLPVVSAIPTLVVAGEYDPVTPAKWAKSAVSHLTNSYYFLFPGGGHGVIGWNRCSRIIMYDFLQDPTQKPDSSCISAMGEPQWVMP